MVLVLIVLAGCATQLPPRAPIEVPSTQDCQTFYSELHGWRIRYEAGLADADEGEEILARQRAAGC